MKFQMRRSSSRTTGALGPLNNIRLSGLDNGHFYPGKALMVLGDAKKLVEDMRTAIP